MSWNGVKSGDKGAAAAAAGTGGGGTGNGAGVSREGAGGALEGGRERLGGAIAERSGGAIEGGLGDRGCGSRSSVVPDPESSSESSRSFSKSASVK
jgi:hypothetical protein